MNSLDDPAYRLELARGYLAKAENWGLIQEPEATTGLEKARQAVALAEAIYSEMAGGTNRDA